MIVVDASAVLDLLLHAPAAERIDARLFDSEDALHAPHLLDVEVTQVLRRNAAAGVIDGERGEIAIGNLRDLPIERHPHGWLLRRIWELRHNFTAYDAAYVALAEVLNASLLTRDRRLAAAAERHVRVELV